MCDALFRPKNKSAILCERAILRAHSESEHPMKSIHERISDLETYMDDAVQWIPDIAPEFSGVEGTHIYNVPEDEYEAMCAEYDTLTDLLNLRTPPLMELCHGGWQCDWTGEELARYEAYCNGEV